MSDVVRSGGVAVGAGHSFFTVETSVSPLVLLMRELRQTIITTLPEIVEIPETIDVSVLNPSTGLLTTPILVMIGKAPRPADAAVGEQCQTLTFDFVYVTVSVIDGITDTQEYVRDQLVKLQNALLSNYRQNGYCNATRTVQDPIDHENQYKLIFAAQAQPITALVLQMEFDVISVLP